jgi:hypothetical protein
VIVFSDSEYVVKGMRQWIKGWKANGWKNSRGKEVSNRDLWEALDQLVSKFKISNSAGSKPMPVTHGTNTPMNWRVRGQKWPKEPWRNSMKTIIYPWNLLGVSKLASQACH